MLTLNSVSSEPAAGQLAAACDRLANENLDALARLDSDPIRRQIDDALTQALGIPDLAPIRELLAREPGLTARDIVPRPSQQRLDLAEDGDEEDNDQEQLELRPFRSK
ncbi:MAG: hypothetical protein AAB322_04450, partial [Pseudomonadota bacterium]